MFELAMPTPRGRNNPIGFNDPYRLLTFTTRTAHSLTTLTAPRDALVVMDA